MDVNRLFERLSAYVWIAFVEDAFRIGDHIKPDLVHIYTSPVEVKVFQIDKDRSNDHFTIYSHVTDFGKVIALILYPQPE